VGTFALTEQVADHVRHRPSAGPFDYFNQGAHVRLACFSVFDDKRGNAFVSGVLEALDHHSECATLRFSASFTLPSPAVVSDRQLGASVPLALRLSTVFDRVAQQLGIVVDFQLASVDGVGSRS
jgi:hypothetical protein